MINSIIISTILQSWHEIIGYIEHLSETIGHPSRVVSIFSVNICIYYSKQ